MKKSSITCDICTAQYENGTIKCEKKNKGTTKYDKSSITCDTDTRQCEDGIIKFEKKIREPPNVTKVQSYAMLVLHNVMMVQLNVRKKNKGTAECDKSTVTCDVGTAQ